MALERIGHKCSIFLQSPAPRQKTARLHAHCLAGRAARTTAVPLQYFSQTPREQEIVLSLVLDKSDMFRTLKATETNSRNKRCDRSLQ